MTNMRIDMTYTKVIKVIGFQDIKQAEVTILGGPPSCLGQWPNLTQDLVCLGDAAVMSRLDLLIMSAS